VAARSPDLAVIGPPLRPRREGTCLLRERGSGIDAVVKARDLRSPEHGGGWEVASCCAVLVRSRMRTLAAGSHSLESECEKVAKGVPFLRPTRAVAGRRR